LQLATETSLLPKTCRDVLLIFGWQRYMLCLIYPAGISLAACFRNKKKKSKKRGIPGMPLKIYQKMLLIFE
jgi:hypothetical protein